MAMDWHLILSRDSTILDAIGAPGRWIGSQLHDRDDIPQNLKDAGRLTLSKANHPASHVAELAPLQVTAGAWKFTATPIRSGTARRSA